MLSFAAGDAVVPNAPRTWLHDERTWRDDPMRAIVEWIAEERES